MKAVPILSLAIWTLSWVDGVWTGTNPEFRGMYVATVENIDWPLSSTGSTDEQKAQIIDILDAMEEMNMNAVLFQVRPVGDALYNSTYEPWSQYLTGKQGLAPEPFYDPLEFMVDEAHLRGIEVHVWLNPYRAGSNAVFEDLADNHMCKKLSQYCYTYGRFLWMDPGSPEVADQLILVLEDILTRYDVDGVHFDDYFYPYPEAVDFPDQDTYAMYGNDMELGDWRRDNVNRMVQRCYETVHRIRSQAVFSISPFALYKPGQEGGMPPPLNGFDPFEGQYADTKLWLQQGWVDFMAPQIYFRNEPESTSFPLILDWWLQEDVNPLNRHVYAAIAAYRAILEGWSVSDILEQVEMTRDDIRRDQGSLGNIQYSAKYFRDNQMGIKTEFININPRPALIPPKPWLDEDRVQGKRST